MSRKGAGALVVLVVALGTTGVILFRGCYGADSSPPAGGVVTEVAADKAAASWAAGRFSRLAGADIPALLDRHLAIAAKTEVTARMDAALRRKLAAFLRAYASTSFKRYLEFRDPGTMCGMDHPAVQKMLSEWSPQLGPRPTDPAALMFSMWRLYIREGLGPVRPGPIIEKVNWQTCAVTIQHLEEDDLVLAEWDETNAGASHLLRELAAGRSELPRYTTRNLAVPNAVSVAELAARDGRVSYADFQIVLRTGDAPAHPIKLRFVWDEQGDNWLPLHAIVFGGGLEKPFIW